MTPLQEEKIRATIYFFASQHKKKTRSDLHQTFLYKYLAFFEFYSLKETGETSLGLHYTAMEHGPVPDEIYKEGLFRNTELYKFENSDNGVIIKPAPKAKVNYDCFAPYEIALLNRLIEIFADRYIKTALMSDASHREIKAWRKAWARKHNSPMENKDEFPDDLFDKPVESLSLPEEHFILHSALNGCR